MTEQIEIEVEKLDIDELYPRDVNDPNGGGIYLVVGPSGSGKSNIIKSLCFSKKHFIPVTLAISESECFNKFYSKFVPQLFIKEKLEESTIDELETRQLIAIKNLPNPYVTLILDDCMNKSRNLTDDVFTRLFKTGRHQKFFCLVALQYYKDIFTRLTNQCAGVFLLKNDNHDIRNGLYTSFGGIFPNKQSFFGAMDSITTDNCALFINFRSTSTEWRDKIRWFKSFDNINNFDWNSCNKDVLKYNNERFDSNFSETRLYFENK